MRRRVLPRLRRAARVLVAVFTLALVLPAHADEFSTPAETTAAFVRALQDALRGRDVTQVAALVAFPLRVNLAGRHRQVSAGRFVREFDQIFPPAVVQEVLRQNPDNVFQNWQGVMVGDGAVWAAETCPGKRPALPARCPLKVIAVNLPGR